MESAAENMQFELAARLRDQLVTVHQSQDRQRIESPENEDADVFGFHYESDMLAVNLFHMRGGKIVDRREMFWEELPELAAMDLAHADEAEVEVEAGLEPSPVEPAPEIHADREQSDLVSVLKAEEDVKVPVFSAATFFSALLKQMYLDQAYVPKHIYV